MKTPDVGINAQEKASSANVSKKRWSVEALPLFLKFNERVLAALQGSGSSPR